MGVTRGDRAVRTVLWGVSLFFVASLVGFSARRLSIDIPNITGTAPLDPEDFDTRYAERPIIAYAHIIPGVVFVVLAPFQLSRLFRRRYLRMHRLVGRVAAPAGIISALLAVIFGVVDPWGGFAEASASLVFGFYMALAIIEGYRAVRNGRTARHRQWMIRAFAVALGVATIRVILSLGEAFDVFTFDEAFGIAFWVGLVVNAVIAELWILRRPQPNMALRPAVA